MTSRYYTEGFTGTKGALARSGQIETEYQSIDTALKSVEVEMDDAVRFTASDFTPPNSPRTRPIAQALWLDSTRLAARS